MSRSTLRSAASSASVLALFALALPAASAAAHQESSTATEGLTAELVAGHPGLFDGRFDAASEDWLAALEADPTSPLAFAGVQALFDLTGLRTRPLDLERVRALRDRVTDGRARLSLADLEDALVMRRAFSDAAVPARGREDLDEIEHWFLLGPYGPLDRIEPLWGAPPEDGPARRFATSYPSSFGTELGWIPATARAGYLSIDDAIQPPTGGELFVAAWIEAELDEGVVELMADFPLEVYWNGELVAREPHRGLTDTPSRHEIAVRFSPDGPDALVVRCDNGYSDGLRARVLTADGGVFDGAVTSVADLASLPDAYPGFVPASPRGRRAAVDGSGPFDAALTMFLERREGAYDRALAISEPADERALPAWLYQRYFALTNANHLPDEVRRRSLLEVESRFEALDLEVPETVQWRARRLLEEDRASDALELARELVAQAPGVPVFAALERDALGQVDPTGVLELVAARRGAERDDADAVARLGQWALARDDFDGALALFERAAALDGRVSAGHAGDVLDLLSGGDEVHLRRALEWIERWRRAAPAATWLDGYAARVRLRLGDADAVERYLRARIDEAPSSPDRWSELGDHLLELGRTDAARAAFERALELGAAPGELRLALDALGVPAASEAFFEAFALEGRDELAAARALDTTASTALALDVRMDWLRPDGSYRSRVHLISVALDRSGTEILHERQVVGTPRVARVLQVDGGTAEPVAVDGTWVMPDLDPGDAVEMVYDIEVGGAPGTAPRLATWRFEDFTQPYLRSRVVVFVPDGLAGRMELFDFDGTHEEIPWEGGTVHVWEVTDSPQLVDEPGRPEDTAIVTWAEYGDDLVLEHVAEEERRSASWSSFVTADVERELRALAREVAGDLPPSERAAALYAAVTDHVLDFSGSGDTTDVWTLRRGRPLGLFAALLDIAGVEHEWALPHPPTPQRLASSARDPFLSYDDFGDWMLRIAPTEPDGAPTWVVLPEGVRGLPLGRVPSFMRGGQVLVLGDDAARLERLPNEPGPPASESRLVVHLADDKSARVEGVLILRDLQGPATREAISQAEPQQRALAARQIASQSVSGLDVEDWEFVDLEVDGADFELRFSGTVSRFVRGTSRKPYCSPVSSPITLTRALGSADRQWPFELLASQAERLRIELHPSPGYALPSEPRRAAVTRDGLDFVVEWTPGEDGSLVIERRFAIDGLRVAPDAMGELIAALGEVEELDSDRVDLVANDD